MSTKPLDLTHHFSSASKRRVPNVLKEYYKFLHLPEMGNLAGGLPFPGSFPFNSVEISLVESTYHSTTNTESSRKSQSVQIPRSTQCNNLAYSIDLDTALQYGGARGYPPLYIWLRKLVNNVYHPNIPYKGQADVIIDGGSADGLSKIYELLFNPWNSDLNNLRDKEGLMVEEFVYAPPVVQARQREINVVPIKMDSEGMLGYGKGSLSDILENWDYSRGKRPHAIYIIPTGQNPTSGILSFSRRKEIYEICSKYDLIIIEDDPYFHLCYQSSRTKNSSSFELNENHDYFTQSGGKSTGYQFLDQLVPSFLNIDRDGRVIRLDSFSKTIAPGCRLGWITAQPSICEQLFRITDGTTQQPSGFVQVIIAKILTETETIKCSEIPNSQASSAWSLGGWIQWLEGLRDTYERRMIKMATILENNRFFVSAESQEIEMFESTWPMGGMFLWMRIWIFNHPLATSMDPRRLMLALWISCTEYPYRVLCVPGGDFAANDTIKETKGYQYLRFCFGAVDEDILEAKSMSFVKACRDFWKIRDSEKIDIILREHDMFTGGDDQDREVIKG